MFYENVYTLLCSLGLGIQQKSTVCFSIPLNMFRSFQRQWGDCGISQDCNYSQR